MEDTKNQTDTLEKKLASVRPTKRQIDWQKTEFYGFIHFNINTFTKKQWGDGTESPSLFSPTNLDATQWIETFKQAGMKGLILTCKHHDGFCLWPSKYTDHTIENSPWKNGNGDLVHEVSKACREYGLKFGIYLSPWDRHEPSYGNSFKYNQFFLNQLEELLTNYGEIFSVWFDGACGEGPNGKKQIYNWEAYYEKIREYQPNACISVCGPDVRWCGNEAGFTRKEEWSVVPVSLQDNEKIQEESQTNIDHQAFITRLPSSEEDLGSRKIVENVDDLIWYPAEVNTSIRPSWFYDDGEDTKVKTVQELMDLYIRTVGGNSTFLLNVPPDTRGLIHENDHEVLYKFGNELRETFKNDLAKEAFISIMKQGKIEENQIFSVVSEDSDQYWIGENKDKERTFLLSFTDPKKISYVILKEHIELGQRIEAFSIEVSKEGKWEKVTEGTVIGYKRICSIPPQYVSEVKIHIQASRMAPTIEQISIY